MSRKISCKKNIDVLRKKQFSRQTKGRQKFIWFSIGIFATIIAVTISVFLYGHIDVKSATFGWLQTDWSGGASTTAIATHANNQTGWTKFFSKDSNVDVTSVPGQASISVTASTSVVTSDADFNAFTLDKAYVSGGAIYIKKQDGGSCSAGTQCVNGWCNANLCQNPWLTGPCAGIVVYYSDAAGTPQWKTTNDACVSSPTSTSPCCVGASCVPYDTSYPANAVLQANNNLDFTVYPARNACKAVGGRLPTMTELSCMYTNRTSYNTYGAFQSSDYWSSTENSATGARVINFNNGGSGGSSKASNAYVRCVK